MREIEFRGKRRNDGKWLYGDLNYGGPKNNHKKIAYITTWEDDLKAGYVVRQETIGQYTGLKDKNGKKIYEGDIVKVDNEIIAKVIWDNDYLGFFLYANEENSINSFENGEQPLYDYEGNTEVIGNIYDDLESLKED